MRCICSSLQSASGDESMPVSTVHRLDHLLWEFLLI